MSGQTVPLSPHYLQARGAFHIGMRRVGLEATTVGCPADTLFAALCHALRQLHGVATLGAFLATYGPGAEPALLVSSAFPYARPTEDAPQTVRLFARPCEPPLGLVEDAGTRKAIKDIHWLSEGVLRTWIGGGDLAAAYAAGECVQGGSVWLTQAEAAALAPLAEGEEDLRLWSQGDVARVTVDRISSASAVYQAGRVRFRPGGGLWFLGRWRDDWRERGLAALRALGDAGLGGERSAGHGQFELLVGEEEPWAVASPGERFLCLSHYYPTRDELPALLGDDVAYELTLRRGWMSSPDWSEPDAAGQPHSGSALRRKAVRMFAEGSVLRRPTDAQNPWLGALADVTPDSFRAHKVWRYGLALLLAYRTERAKEADDG